jgi:hypothetical protein
LKYLLRQQLVKLGLVEICRDLLAMEVTDFDLTTYTSNIKQNKTRDAQDDANDKQTLDILKRHSLGVCIL